MAQELENIMEGPQEPPPVQPIIPRSSDRQCLTWQRVAVRSSAVPPPRSGAASVVVKGRLYVFGGYGGGTGRLDDFWSFSFENGTWQEVEVLSEEKPGCRENNGVVISDSSRTIYLFGGYNGNCWLNDLWSFDIETARWTCIQENSDSRTDEPMAAVNDAPMQAGQVKGKSPSRRFGYVSVGLLLVNRIKNHHSRLLTLVFCFRFFEGRARGKVYRLRRIRWQQMVSGQVSRMNLLHSLPFSSLNDFSG